MNAYLESCNVFLDTVKNDLTAFAENMNMEEIDGALVGGASLEPLKFIEIINF